ncbi:FkbM family methyltransferase [Natronospira proteinivora]|uniref:FkbM family methyltransferase n=1 Tax=Natronospira proteinivora TaxID=1807133 RepID=A0ABT1G6L3_9GAMM|nr:FkbM family methyltransferase [Natronospira proteinivora]MCP1726944.1 FkbM family methyltransferase [Natronospira proteinivora]
MYLPRFIETRLKRRRQKHAEALFHQLPLGPNDLVIDGGANVGKITALLAGTGAKVLAYEPNPEAFVQLQCAFEGHPRVECVPQALSDHNGSELLYQHKRHKPGCLDHSEAASLISDKRNIDPDHPIKVECRDIRNLMDSLNTRVRLMKLDVEGAEFAILHRLIDTGHIHQIDQIFCETHELKARSLRKEREHLRKRLRREEIRHVNLDWG